MREKILVTRAVIEDIMQATTSQNIIRQHITKSCDTSTYRSYSVVVVAELNAFIIS